MSISEEQLRESIDTIRKVSAELESSTLGLEYQAGKVFDLADAAHELANHLDPVNTTDVDGMNLIDELPERGCAR